MRKDLSVLLAGVSVLLVLNLSACSEPGRSYYPDLGFSIKFPPDWEKRDPKGNIVKTQSSTKSGGSTVASIQVVMFEGQNDLNTFFGDALASAGTTATDFQEEGKGDTTIDGADVKWMSFSYSSKGTSFRTLRYYVLKGSRIYYIGCDALAETFDEWKGRFEETAESFRGE
jgi:hypothetical protein